MCLSSTMSVLGARFHLPIAPTLRQASLAVARLDSSSSPFTRSHVSSSDSFCANLALKESGIGRSVVRVGLMRQMWVSLNALDSNIFN